LKVARFVDGGGSKFYPHDLTMILFAFSAILECNYLLSFVYPIFLFL